MCLIVVQFFDPYPVKSNKTQVKLSSNQPHKHKNKCIC